jgi:hypothetical protein
MCVYGGTSVVAQGGLADATTAHACQINTSPMDLRPALVPAVSRARTKLDTKCGTISLEYTRHGGAQCLRVPEGQSATRPHAPYVKPVVLDCGDRGGVVQRIDVASWGTTDVAATASQCGAMAPEAIMASIPARCRAHVARVTAAVASRCVGQRHCTLTANSDTWRAIVGNTTCDMDLADVMPHGSNPRVLRVAATCSGAHALTGAVVVPIGTRATVRLPVAAVHRAVSTGNSPVQLRVNDQVVSEATPEADGTVHVTVGSGVHALVLTTADE